MTGAVCSARGCHKPITKAGAITDRNGRIYCRRHGDRLPPYLRRTRTPKKETTP